jgi:hypothetical protein
MTPDLLGLIRVLSQAGVQYIIVGGVAANVHGALRTTLDLDVVYSRERENVARLAAALRPYNPYPRGAPAGLPFIFDAATIERGLNFSLTTSLGDWICSAKSRAEARTIGCGRARSQSSWRISYASSFRSRRWWR